MSWPSLWYIGNEHNQCGIQGNETKNDKHITSSKRLKLCEWSKSKRLTKVSRGNGFNVYTISSIRNELLTFGYIRNNDTDNIIPNDVQIVCLKYFGSKYSEYWSSGKDFCNQYNCWQKPLIIKPPKKLFETNNYTKLYIGIDAMCILAISADDKLFVMGNNVYGELGLDNEDKQHSLIESCRNIPNASIINAASSEGCNIIVCNDGSVWSSGDGEEFGENGHKRDPVRTTIFTQILSMKDVKVNKVSMGAGFSIFLTQTGVLYSCGDNDHGQLGLGYLSDDEEAIYPTQIEYFCKNNVKIKDVTCGQSHCIALSDNCKIYSWGSNYWGQCGVGKKINYRIHTPTLLKQLLDQKIVSIKCGCSHSACITDKGQVYLWGCNDFNTCCINDFNDKMDKIYTPCCVNQYILTISNKKHIIDVILGTRTTMFLLL
eukprot:233103_1